MIWIGLIAVAVFGMIILAARVEISEAGKVDAAQPQCTPSRPCVTGRKMKRGAIRWFELERLVKERENTPRG